MGRFRKWRALIKPESLPADVFAALTDDLYGPLVSFAVGASTATLVGGIARSPHGQSVADCSDGYRRCSRRDAHARHSLLPRAQTHHRR